VAANNYANYRVINGVQLASDSIGSVLQINSSLSSFVNDRKEGFSYVELIKRILFKDLQLQNKNILVLGAGGFTLSAAGEYGNSFTYVDIDPHIKNIVQHHFLPQINGHFIAQDARVFMRENKKPYDVIISDVYSNINTIPSDMLTVEHFQNIKRSVTDGGYAIFNIISRPFLDDKYSKRTDSTLRYVFKNCVVIPQTYSTDLTNMIYVCKKSRNESEEIVYKDDKNSSTIDYFNKS
jgi:spermidine synthase